MSNHLELDPPTRFTPDLGEDEELRRWIEMEQRIKMDEALARIDAEQDETHRQNELESRLQNTGRVAHEAAVTARSAGRQSKMLTNVVAIVLSLLVAAATYHLLDGSPDANPAGTPVDTAAPGNAAPGGGWLSSTRSTSVRPKSPERAPAL